MSSALDAFSPYTREWFTQTFGAPTPPQAQGWLAIQRGNHALILAPTGSGKTLAAFLWGINELYLELSHLKSPISQSLRLLYVSPLKALNNDIERNLRAPLAGIRDVAARMGHALPELRAAVRTGDTPARERTAMWKKPPHIFITTPESLYLMLTSPRAREIFRAVRTVILDEIHALVGNKRGAHLALSLERLEQLATERVQRIGLSATIKPLEEAARWLGGQTADDRPQTADNQSAIRNPQSAIPRPVTIVNATYHKPLDLRVVTVVDDLSKLQTTSIWPLIVPQVLNEIRQHKTTLIFANNRRLAERTADRLNAQLDAEQKEEIEPGSPHALAPRGIARDQGMFAIGAAGPFRAHHGSMSKQARREMEEDLKAGKLPALVGTSSLELGIDIGAIDAVVQLQSPKSVAQGLQRVGRSGHLVGQTSVGRIYATFREDLVEAAAIARGMLDGAVESTLAPQNPLDVLAQQIVAMVACEEWDARALFDLVRRAYPCRDLVWAAFVSVLEMLSGKYQLVGAHGRAPLRAKISFDRVNNRLRALPGSRWLAIQNAGTIPDTGAYAVYLGDNKTKIGEVDEEFVFETRAGDNFLLGSRVWRVQEIKDDRLIVGDATGAAPRMPFWNGDYPYRPYELGLRIGKFRREIAERVRDVPPERLYQELQREYALDENSARNLVAHVQRQIDAVGVLSSDTTIVAETFQDAVGEARLVIHSPFGGRVNGAWALALKSAMEERYRIEVEMQTNDDGILFRFPSLQSAPPTDLVREMSSAEARTRILHELPNSALFGARFRMNAARALLLPKARGKKRTPFWLQRLKAKDLLAIARQLDDFPIVAETYRDCLRDALDLQHLEEVLEKIARTEIRVVPIETAIPSPVAAGLLFQFASIYLYEWDAPKAEKQLHALTLHREFVDDLLADANERAVLKPAAVEESVARAQHLAPGYQARSAEELALVLQELGDLTMAEVIARCAGDARAWLAQLAAEGRAVEIVFATRRGEETRWVIVAAEGGKGAEERGREGETLRRFLAHSGPVTREEMLNRYAFDETWLGKILEHLVETRQILKGQFTQPPNHPTTEPAIQYCDRRLLEHIHRHTLTLLRKEIQPVSIFAYADFLVRWQHAHPGARLTGAEPTRRALEQLRGIGLPVEVWTRDVLPARAAEFDARELEALCASGELVWVADKSRARFFFRGEGALFLGALEARFLEESGLLPDARRVYEFLKTEGASFVADIETGVGLKRDVVHNALAELAQASFVTNDSLDALRVIFSGATARVAPTPTENEIAARLQTPRALTSSRYRDAKRRVAKRLRAELPASAWDGRWSLVPRASVMGAALSDDARAEKLARVLLERYGVVTRECLEREEIASDWGALYAVLARAEMRGEVRRGYFAQGLSGAQFALPKAGEELRAAANADGAAFVVLNATDPANIFGGEITDTPFRFARVPSTYVVLSRGQPLLIAEENGARVTTAREIAAEKIAGAMRAFLARPNAARHIAVREWNGAAVLGSAGEAVLQALGFHRTPKGMEG